MKVFKKILIKKDFSQCWVDCGDEPRIMQLAKKGWITIETEGFNIIQKKEEKQDKSKRPTINLNPKIKEFSITHGDKTLIKIRKI